VEYSRIGYGDCEYERVEIEFDSLH